jgi:biopolymer transport protein ExbB
MYSILLSAGWPIWPLLIISIIGLAIAIERSWYLRQTHIFPKGLLESVFTSANQLANQSSNPKLDDSHLESLFNQSPASLLLTCVLKEKIAGANADSALEELQVLAQSTWIKFDRYLGILATIATVAPLLGLFGTVVGMIEIFGSQGAINGAGSPQQLAHGISVALYNTAFGLLIAIPALAAWRGLRAMANQRQRECEEFTRQLFKKLFPTETAS